MRAPIIAWAGLLMAAPLSAQQPAARPVVTLTVDEAVARGLAESHRIAEAVARGEAATAAIGQQRAASLPQIAVLAGYTRTNHVDEFRILAPPYGLFTIYPDVPDNWRTRLDLQWPIFTSGRLDALERAARAEAAASASDIEQTRGDLRLEIKRSYWALVTAREAIAVVQGSLDQTTEHLRDVRNQLDAGLVPPNDVSTAAAQEARQRMLLVQATVDRDVTAAALARLVGIDPNAEIVPTSALDVRSPERQPVGALLAEARRARPERAGLEQRITAWDERSRAASAGRKPTVSIAAGVDYARPNPRIFPRVDEFNESWDASANVTWALFDGSRSRADVAQAAANGRAARERLEEFDSVMGVEIRQRLAELNASDAAIAAADAEVLAANDARRVVGNRFTAGVATSTDVIDAQVRVLQAGLDRTQSLANTRVAEARLDRALGR
ncbi:MAG TPA: TolC family protein [Vicinamibacterales bacterium]|jgi:outer membrane protein TolC